MKVILQDNVANRVLSTIGEFGWGGAASTASLVDPSEEITMSNQWRNRRGESPVDDRETASCVVSHDRAAATSQMLLVSQMRREIRWRKKSDAAV